MGLRVCLQRHTKVFDASRPIGGIFLKCILIYCIKYNEINMRHLGIYNRMFPMKNSLNILYRDSHKRIPMYCGQWVKIVNSSF